ncbi:energy-coupling factor ABC transporter ATP-binding protein [Neptunomonas marina]|uniref:ABC transporter ATP-binding protein n=1 Tax=Neptunomonas marina TaxID=1815562 RepID=A0A437Q444_9GAMM|nr:ABC transporter ATP-binding protein [Neptunomonas marina]RVU29298.1 ABC transporter ATP-binding protein [Neptunomonas marina]
MSCVLRCAGIHYHYPRRDAVLKDVNFCLQAGERLAIEGTNGAGKTTLLHILVGLTKAKAGYVEAFGTRCHDESAFQAMRFQVGLLFQDSDDQLFCPTVLEDVMFGPLNQGKSVQAAQQLALDALSQLGLEGFDSRIAYQLSGGEKRLVALASLLAMQPQVLLLDEPTNGLDSKTRERLIEIIRALPQAMIIVSHDSDFVAAVATRSQQLCDGRLTSEETV